MWTKWFVLAACVVITQSFPRPNEEPQIPVELLTEPSQYYVLRENGDFKYGYNTGKGAYESAVKTGSGDLIGYFGYVDAFGKNVRLDYTAGVGGFVPRSSLLPVAPQVDAASVGSTVPESAADPSGVISESAPRPLPFEEPDVRSASNLGGSYSSQSESTDSSTDVVGQELFAADDGQNQQIRSSAGSETAYVAKEDSIEVVPGAPRGAAGRSVFASTFSSDPFDLSIVPVGASVTSERSIEQTITPRGDASFFFRFQKPDSSLEDNADSDRNVKLRNNFVSNDLIQRKLNYIAGSASGFVAEEDHMLAAPEATGISDSGSTEASRATVYSGSGSQSFSSSFGSTASLNMVSDPSYSSKYYAVESARDETTDNNLNVKMQFSLDDDDGMTGTVQSPAVSGTEFNAEGFYLRFPVSDIATRATSGSTGNQLRFSGGSLTGEGQMSGSTSGSPGIASFRRQDVPGDIIFESNSGNDGGYKFSYTNPDNFRSETADKDLNVRGVYSFIADDGIERHIHYRAGSGTGFVAEGTHLPVSVSDPSLGAT